MSSSPPISGRLPLLLARIGPLFGCALSNPHNGWQKYVLAAWLWLFVSLALGPGATMVTLLTGGNESLLLLDAARHALAFGFATQMVLGVASRVVPNFTGKPLWSPNAREAAFYFLNGSMAIRAIEVPIALGHWPGAWPFLAWAGPLGVLAMAFFATNVMMTVRQRSSPLLQPIVPVNALQPNASRSP
jgi:NnrS protein